MAARFNLISSLLLLAALFIQGTSVSYWVQETARENHEITFGKGTTEFVTVTSGKNQLKKQRCENIQTFPASLHPLTDKGVSFTRHQDQSDLYILFRVFRI